MKFVLNISWIYHKNKIRVLLEKHIFMSYMTSIYFYCILGVLKHKNAVNTKYQGAVKALRASLSFSFPDGSSGPHFSPSQHSWCLPWCSLGWQAPALSQTPSESSQLISLHWALPWFVTCLVWGCQGTQRPVTGAAGCGQLFWYWVTLVSQLYIP